MAWTAEKVEMLRTMVEKGGRSCSQMGDVLGMSRNAVIGKLHRLKLQVKRPPNREGGMAKPSARQRAKRILIPPAVTQMRRLAEQMRAATPAPAALLPTVPPSEPGVLGVSLLNLAPNGCRYPVNRSPTPSDPHLFCNQPRKDGSSYCECCHAKAYVVRKTERRARVRPFKLPRAA